MASSKNKSPDDAAAANDSSSSSSSSLSSSKSSTDSRSLSSRGEKNRNYQHPENLLNDGNRKITLDLENDENESKEENGDDDHDGDNRGNNGSITLKVNKKYATEYQNRKEREELRQIEQERTARGLLNENDNDESSSSSDEEEDEDGALLTPSVNVQFFKTIQALRRKEKSIYDPNQKFFQFTTDTSTTKDNEEQTHEQQNRQPKRFKDVIREQIMEQMEQDDSNDSSESSLEEKGIEHSQSRSKLAYNEQQDELRQAFLKESAKLDQEVSENDDGDDEIEEGNGDEWMVVKKKAAPVKDDDSLEREAAKQLEELQKLPEQQKTSRRNNGVPTFQDPRGEIEDGEQFLLDFIKNKKWIDKSDRDEESDDEDGKVKPNNDDDDDESLEDVEKADEFESNYNFRFEQAAAETGSSGALLSVKTYARGQTMNTLRREENTRKEKREARKERKAAERKAKEEQLKRLKNAKRQELNKKLDQVKSVIGKADDGAVDEVVLMKMLDGDYDPETFDKAMHEAYGDEFYQKKDLEWKTDLDVRKSLQEDDEGDTLVGQDDVDGGMYDTFDGETEGDNYNAQEDDQDYDESQEWDEDDNNNYDNPEEDTELEKKIKSKMQDELYKLDYEDIVAGMPTRFKYREVEPNDYGLTTQEILFARDTTLKQFVSLKKMAPYNEQAEFEVGSKRRRKFREQLREELKELVTETEDGNPKEVTAAEEAKEGADGEPRTKKRRRLKKGKKKQKENSVTEEPQKVPEDNPTKDDGSTKKHGKASSDPSKKLKRKKSGKNAMGAVTADDLEKRSPEDEHASHKSSTTTHSTKSFSTRSDAGKTIHKSNDNKMKKKKKRKLVEGVSNSRLAAYGL